MNLQISIIAIVLCFETGINPVLTAKSIPVNLFFWNGGQRVANNSAGELLQLHGLMRVPFWSSASTPSGGVVADRGHSSSDHLTV